MLSKADFHQDEWRVREGPEGDIGELDVTPEADTKPSGRGRSNDSFVVILNIATSGARFGLAAQKIGLWQLTKDAVGATRPSES
jgi:hypothetical protein